ncbi:conserved membrane protein of unknown function [Candidatus Promineifilum breve]|uniref:HXXEE domain-containing protein n=1 Tax=Candidatus Promineifilum breve TaxID=1806508 RepID=A0A160T025_9CHLR|nr:HXXEE domain-containing protein [Candidatus Promineifilum breve]CUS03231.2 conserved membrane protein of unknown function [Candidatus Promineifilum breve]
MNFMRKNWYYVGAALFVVLGIGLAIFWNDMSLLRKLMWLSFMALLAHQFEEYGRPGGFPAVTNIAWMPSADGKPDRYKLNRQGALFANVFFGYLFYILAILFPNLIWVGLATVLFGMAQLGVHGIIINRKLRSIYNPGLFTVVFLFWPIGLYYIWYVVVNQLVQWWMWPLAIVYLALAAYFGLYVLAFRIFADPNSPYPFEPSEMERFHVKEKLAKMSA